MRFRLWRRALTFVGSALLTLTGALAQQYHTNDVTPPVTSGGGKLNGGNSGKQVGEAQNHAYLLNGNALTGVDLNPTGYYSSSAGSISSDGSQQCGRGVGPTFTEHPVLWSGTAASAVDLIPSGYNFGACTSVDNGTETGYAQNQSYFVTASHAYVWSGTPGSGVDIHPLGTIYPYSKGMSTKNGEQAGYLSSFAYPLGDNSNHAGSHAYKWNGTAASAVDLHPAAYAASEARATNGTQQGGVGYSALGIQHGLLWSGTPESVVDLHPAAYYDSRVHAMTDTLQVGDGWVGVPNNLGSVRHALVWSGTADSVVDLNQYLPAGYTHAVATGVDASGNVVGYAYNGASFSDLTPPATAIAVVFAPGPPPASQLTSVTLDSANVAPGALVTGTATLASAAPAEGVTLNFASTNLTLAPAPAAVAIPGGSSSASFTLSLGGSTLTTPSALKVYATDGTVSKFASLTVTPVVKLSSLSINPVEGGFATTATIALSIPAQAGGATVSLVSSNPALVSVPASVLIPQGYTVWSFTATTGSVAAATSVPVTATLSDITLSTNVALSQAPVVAISAITANSVVGGQTLSGTVSLNNFVRAAAGATITLASGDANTVQLPATVFIPTGSSTGYFTATTAVVNGAKGVSLRASFNGSQVSTTVTISPIPPITVTSAVYKASTQLLKVDATTNDLSSVLTYGVNGVPFATMQFEAGIYQGSILLPTAPATVTVWSSYGASVTVPVTDGSTSTGGGVGGGGGGGNAGGGGGGSTSTSYKLTTGKTGKGTVTVSPAAATYAPGTVVRVTATPDPGSPWIGWSGACAGTAPTCTVTMNSNLSVTANFK